MNNLDKSGWREVTPRLVNTFYDTAPPYCRQCKEEIPESTLVTIDTDGLHDGGFVCTTCTEAILDKIRQNFNL